MKEEFSLKNLFPSYDGKYGARDLARYNYIGDEIILSIFTVFICLVGLVGNGNVIWLLGFRVKRKPFASYILNLAVADFGSLAFVFTLNIFVNPSYCNGCIGVPVIVIKILVTPFMFMYSSSQFLLSAIGIDRCVSVLFPNWYQCQQSPVSSRVCVLIWVLSFLLGGVPLILVFTRLAFYYYYVLILVNGVSTLICFLLVTVSSLTLLIKVCNKSQQCHLGDLLKVVLLMLLSFLLFTVLTYACAYLIEFPFILLEYYTLGTSLKSSINPLIYFLAGRQKGGKFQEGMKVILQRVFKEERDSRIELRPHIDTQLRCPH